MRLLQVYNQYRSLFGGEETVVRQIGDMVEEHGGEARLIMKSSRDMDMALTTKIRAFSSGFYNPFASRDMARSLSAWRPDVVHVHNLYPMFSPSVLVAIRRAGIPTVMTVHNHFHTCPTAANFYKGEVCERCVGGREISCVLQNCRESLPESVAYAVRSAVARKFGLFTRNITTVIALNDFAKQRLVGAGFSSDQVVVLPNSVEIPASAVDASRGEYAVFSGRMCPEKGVDTLVEAAGLAPDVPVRLLGGGPTLEELSRNAPQNTVFLGQVSPEDVDREYRSARFVVVPSRWFEGCPLVIIEAMSQGLPVIASRIGGLPELVEDGVNGLLFEPGNAEELAQKMRDLWEAPERCRAMGRESRLKAEREFSRSDFWERLEAIYADAKERFDLKTNASEEVG